MAAAKTTGRDLVLLLASGLDLGTLVRRHPFLFTGAAAFVGFRAGRRWQRRRAGVAPEGRAAAAGADSGGAPPRRIFSGFLRGSLRCAIHVAAALVRARDSWPHGRSG